jgi:lysophospholipase L1-like esterase
MSLIRWQTKYLIGAAAILPAAPFLYVQGQVTRRRIGILPDAGGATTGILGDGGEPVRLLVIGESTVAGLGARTHESALTGHFARGIAGRIGRPVNWTAVGKNGVTAERTILELLPRVERDRFDYILVGLGGNDVLKLSSPVKWRRTMTELLERLRERNPEAPIFLSNCPMIKLSPAIPQPIKGILWELSKMHDANIAEVTRPLERVYYYPQPKELEIEGFFADGIHPSEKGYSDWAAAMLEYFDGLYKW